MWDKLSMAEKAKYIRLGVQNGITSLNDIKEVYNTYADGGPYSAGKMSDALYEAAKKVERLGDPDHHYDFNQTDEWADAHGYYLDNRGHRDDRVKKLAHPTHPSRGKWNGLNEFQLTELGMKDPNYTMFGMADGDQDPQATLTYKGDIVLPEITVTPKANYIHNSYDNLNIKYGIGGTLRKRIRSALGKSTNRQDTRINTRQFQSGNTEQVDRTNVRRVNPSQVQNKIQDNQNKAVAYQILKRRYPQAAADGMDYEGLVNLDKSTTPVSFNGKVYVGGNYQPQETSYSQDNKSNQEHKQAQAAFIQNQEQQRKEDEIKQTVELLNNPYNPIGWIPGLRSVVNAGADQNYFRTYNTAFTPYTADAAFSTAGDAVTLGFGLGPYKNYAGSYAGTVAGGLIGEQFDNPQLGQIIGGITGGFSSQIYNSTMKGIQSGQRAYNIFRLSRELNKAANSFDGTVGTDYFKSLSNWYRITESPEIMDLRYQGKNITTRDIGSYDSPSNDFRDFVIENKLKPGTGENEGYWIMPKKKSRISLTKMGAAHGNTSQAAKGQIWDGTFAYSKVFPAYIIEGEGPTEVFRGFNPATGTDSRTNFVKVPWEEVPFGARVGFHTGEMPMEGLRAFRQLPNGRYQYEGSILPDRIIRIDNPSLSQLNPQNTLFTEYEFPLLTLIRKQQSSTSSKK